MGEWFATFGVEIDREPPQKPDQPKNVVGTDVGILKYAYDTDGHAVESVDLSGERDRLKREQRKLSRKEHGSNNHEEQRCRVAECHADLKNKRQTSCINSRTTTLESTISWPSKTLTRKD